MSTTPLSAMKTVVFPAIPVPCADVPRPPVTMKRLSFTFSRRISPEVGCAPSTAIDSAPSTTRAPRTTTLFISPLFFILHSSFFILHSSFFIVHCSFLRHLKDRELLAAYRTHPELLA